MSQVNVGVVGLGAIAKRVHIPILSSFEDTRITSVAEVNRKRSEKITKKWNVPQYYEDYHKMYRESNLDAVFICLPNYLHFDAARSAIEHGIHVFCEKPMGLRSVDAFELVKMARKKNLVLAVGYNRRLAKNYGKACKIVKSLKLGNILQAHAILVAAGPYVGWIPSSNWFLNDKFGVLYDLGSHVVDLMMCVLTDRIAELSAVGMSTMHGFNVYDNIACTFRTEKGTVGTFNTGWRTSQDHSEIQVHGTAGSLFANPIEIEVRHGRYDSLERVAHHLKSVRKHIRPRQRSNDTYFEEDRAFIDAICCNKEPLVSGEEGLRVLEILDTVKESLERQERRLVVSFRKL